MSKPEACYHLAREKSGTKDIGTSKRNKENKTRELGHTVEATNTRNKKTNAQNLGKEHSIKYVVEWGRTRGQA